MQHALAQAELALGHSDPNPSVGAVIVSASGQLLGAGHTQAVGGPHAEIMALRDAAARGHDVRGATAYVTLEPCAHHGRTGPCCQALSAAGIARVVAALRDPNPRVAGGGFAHLQAHGVQVDVGDGAEQATEHMRGFLSRMTRGRPWVRLKVAASLDGFTALPNGQSQWITGEAARADGQRWRQRASCVLTGTGTLLADDPLLNVRLPGATRQPALCVVDSQLRSPPQAAAWRVPHRQVWIATTEPMLREQRLAPSPNQALADEQTAWLARRDALLTALAPCLDPQRPMGHLLTLPPAPGSTHIDLHTLLHDLAEREVNEVHVEAGAGLNGALLQAGLVDEVLAYLAPALMGAGKGWADGLGSNPGSGLNLGLNLGPDLGLSAARSGAPAFTHMNQVPRGRFIEATPLGPDLRLRLLLGPA
jgi:diaminohydroxyphosphoribosylaminopyrimidine deaminase/5-amino-6-(5-phosphoribosylamino)uracil reductase